jgi:hypothetical protein
MGGIVKQCHLLLSHITHAGQRQAKQRSADCRSDLLACVRNRPCPRAPRLAAHKSAHSVSAPLFSAAPGSVITMGQQTHLVSQLIRSLLSCYNTCCTRTVSWFALNMMPLAYQCARNAGNPTGRFIPPSCIPPE